MTNFPQHLLLIFLINSPVHGELLSELFPIANVIRVPTGGPNFGARVLIRSHWPKGYKLAPKKALDSELAPNWL